MLLSISIDDEVLRKSRHVVFEKVCPGVLHKYNLFTARPGAHLEPSLLNIFGTGRMDKGQLRRESAGGRTGADHLGVLLPSTYLTWVQVDRSGPTWSCSC